MDLSRIVLHTLLATVKIGDGVKTPKKNVLILRLFLQMQTYNVKLEALIEASTIFIYNK